MVDASDAVWLSVLPDMSGFSKGIVRGVGKQGTTAGKSIGRTVGLGIVAGITAVAAVGKGLYEIGATFDEMADTIQVGTGATGAALDGLVESAKNIGRQVPAEFDQIGDAVAALNTHTGATGDVLEGLTGSVLEASRMLGEDGTANADKFGRAMVQWQIPAEEGEGALDALYVATQKYGVGMNELMGHLNAYGPVLQNAGFSMDESAALFGQLEQGGISVSRVMPGLNASFRKWAGEGKNSREELERSVDAIKNTEDAQEALSMATETFGAEGAQRLTTAIRNGSLELGDLTDSLADSEGAIASSSEETQSFAEKWQMFKNDILARIEPAATRLFDAISNGMTWLMDTGAPAVESFVSEWRDRLEPTFNRVGAFITGTLIPGFQDFIGWLKQNAEWLKPIAVGIGTMIALWKAYQVTLIAVGAVQKAWTAITTGMTAAQKLLNGALRANPIGIIITLLTGLVAGLVYAYKNSETFRNVVNGVWAAIKGAVKAVWEWLRDKVFKPLVQWFKDMGDRGVRLKDGMVGAWNTMKDALGRAWDWIYKNVIMAFASRIRWLQVQFQLKVMQIRRIWEGIKAVFRAVYNWVKQRVFDAFRTAANNLRNNFSNVVQRIKDIWSGIKNAFKSVKDWVVRNVINKFKDSFDSLLSKVRTIRDRIGDAWRGIANKFRRPINWVINRVWNDGIAKAFNSAASAIGISTRLPDEAAIPAFAKGGYHKGGWALVGEEGPELVNFAQPGQVYTAKQTREIMNSGPVGDLKDDLASALGSTAGSLAGVTVGGAVEGLKAAAAAVLNPLKTLISNTVGQWGRFGRLGGGVGTRAIDEVLKWIGKKEEAELAKTTGSLHGGTAPGSGAWRRPSRGPITSGYGPRWGSFHAGIDVAGGGPTYAAAAGRVYRVGSGILGGRTGIGIGISHGGGVFTYYGHNPVGGPRVRPGQRVQAGQHIGYQGATGNVTGTHLHFELHRGGWGRHVNPRQLGVFDKGGMLAPGAMAINLGSKPEPVLTPGQWDTLQDAATNAPGLSAKEQYRALYEGARDGVASGFSGGTRTTRTYARQGGF